LLHKRAYKRVSINVLHNAARAWGFYFFTAVRKRSEIPNGWQLLYFSVFCGMNQELIVSIFLEKSELDGTTQQFPLSAGRD
jgi:hypothetical protein